MSAVLFTFLAFFAGTVFGLKLAAWSNPKKRVLLSCGRIRELLWKIIRVRDLEDRATMSVVNELVTEIERIEHDVVTSVI
jgi:hypothetical protein